MNVMKKAALGVLTAVLCLGVAPVTQAQVLQPTVAVQVSAARDCVANNNLDEMAATFISRCRKASIRREFPGTHLSQDLGEIKAGSSANDRKAWKLLNDNRFKK